jgi:hypothetical protein
MLVFIQLWISILAHNFCVLKSALHLTFVKSEKRLTWKVECFLNFHCAFLQACNRGNRGVVRVLLEFGADLNLKGFGKDSPLHDAARNGHIKVKSLFPRIKLLMSVFHSFVQFDTRSPIEVLLCMWYWLMARKYWKQAHQFRMVPVVMLCLRDGCWEVQFEHNYKCAMYNLRSRQTSVVLVVVKATAQTCWTKYVDPFLVRQ